MAQKLEDKHTNMDLKELQTLKREEKRFKKKNRKQMCRQGKGGGERVKVRKGHCRVMTGLARNDRAGYRRDMQGTDMAGEGTRQEKVIRKKNAG